MASHFNELIMAAIEQRSSTLNSTQHLCIKMQSENYWNTGIIRSPSEIDRFEAPRSFEDEETDCNLFRLRDEQDTYDINDEFVVENMYDEVQEGKDLIMSMFLKSTQVFHHQESLVIEKESNVNYVENVTANTLVSMNMKSRTELKQKFQSMEFQTFFQDDKASIAPKQFENGRIFDFLPSEENYSQNFPLPDTYRPVEPTGQYSEPDFYDFPPERDWDNMAQRKPYFKMPRVEPVRFTGCGLEGNHDLAQNFSTPAQFVNYLGNGYTAGNPSKNPSRFDNHCDSGCRYHHNQDLDYGYTITGKPDSSISYETRSSQWMNFEGNVPNLSLGFGNSPRNNVIDLIEANKERKEELFEFKPDFSRDQENIPDLTWNFQSFHKHEVEFNPNSFLSTRRDPSTAFRDQRNVTEFDPDFLNANKVRYNPFQIRTQADDQGKYKLTLNFQNANSENREVAGVKQSNLPKEWGKRRPRKGKNFRC